MPSSRARRAAARVQHRRRRRAGAAAATVAAGAVVMGLAVVGRGDGGQADPDQRPKVSETRAGAEVLARRGSGEPLLPSAAPASYHLVYRVDDHAGGEHVVSTEELWVSRPFEGFSARLTGAPPGQEVRSKQVTRLGRLESTGDEGLSLEVAPDIAGPDLRFAPVLPAALADGTVLARERRRVQGRTCQVYRTGGPVGGAELVPYDPDHTEYADVCLDRAGLVLEELWVVDARVMRRRLATKVEVEPDIDGARFDALEAAVPASEGGGSFRPVDPASRPEGPFWELPAPPAGFELVGRFAVVAPDLSTAAGEPPDPVTARERRVFTISDVWTRGVDVLILDRGGTLSGDPVFADPGPDGVDLGALGRAAIRPRLRLSEIRVPLPEGRFVALRGTLPPDALVEFARRVEPVPGGDGLVYLD